MSRLKNKVAVITGGTLYGAAKAAVIYFAKGFSSDLLDRKIRVNVITPGTTQQLLVKV